MPSTHRLRKVFTGKAPFVGSTAPAVIASITSGKRPERPSHTSFTDYLWELTQKCLEQAPLDRPNVDQALEALRKLSVPPRLDDAYSTHRPSLRRADQTALTLPTTLGRSPEQEAALTNSRAVPSPTLAKTCTNGGETVSPDQTDTQPLQALNGGTHYTTSRESIHMPPQVRFT